MRTKRNGEPAPEMVDALEVGEPIIMDGENLFEDLGRPNADELLIRSELLNRVRAELKVRGLKGAEAAKLLGTAAPEISHLMNGRVSRFSIERLIRMLRALEPDVRVSLAFFKEGKAEAEAAS